MKYIATIVLASALLSTHAIRDDGGEDDLDFQEATSGIALSSLRRSRVAAQGATLTEFLANLRANRARGRSVVYGCENNAPPKEKLPERWTKQLDLGNATCVGEGGFGRVFLVPAKCDPTFSLALKEQSLKTAKAEALAKGEAQLMREIKDAQVENSNTEDRHIVTYHDDVLVRSHAYILMEALRGRDLFHTLEATGVNVTVKLALFAEALSGVVRLHQLGVAHLDLKPENVLVTADCTKGDCHGKVGDFGLACKTEPKPDGVCTEIGGTPEYWAPEVFLAKSGQKSDVWAMGMILYEVLHGLYKSPVLPCKEGHRWLRQHAEFYDLQDNEMPGLKQDPKVKYIWKCLSSPDNITIPEEAQQTKEGKAFKDLLLRMLQKDPRERCTAREALEQFTVAAQGIVGLEERILANYTDTSALPTCMEPFEKADPEPKAKSKEAAKPRTGGGVADLITGMCGGKFPCIGL